MDLLSIKANTVPYRHMLIEYSNLALFNILDDSFKMFSWCLWVFSYEFIANVMGKHQGWRFSILFLSFTFCCSVILPFFRSCSGCSAHPIIVGSASQFLSADNKSKEWKISHKILPFPLTHHICSKPNWTYSAFYWHFS